jgi:hypothetical protein
MNQCHALLQNVTYSHTVNVALGIFDQQLIDKLSAVDVYATPPTLKLPHIPDVQGF